MDLRRFYNKQQALSEDVELVDAEAVNYFDNALNMLDNISNETKIAENDIKEIDDFIDEIYALRKEGLKSEGEYGVKNLIFKEFRNKGYLDKLKELKTKVKEKNLCLEKYLK